MRYIGGKFRIRKKLIDYLSHYFTETNCFVEPFVGSANVSGYLIKDNGLYISDDFKLIINDFHKDLVLMWEDIVDGIFIPPDSCTEERYEELRNAESSAERGFIGHSCSFGGIWFSKFAKTSDGRNYCLNGKNSIVKIADALRWVKTNRNGLEIYNLSYEQVPIPDGALVYNDPPYLDTSRPGSGNEFDHEKFWQWVRELSSRCTVFTSEYQAPEDFECVENWSVSLDMGKRENRVERLFKYKGGCIV